MSAGWQELFAYAAVLAAMLAIVVRWRRGKARACSACPAGTSPRASARGVRSRGLTIVP